MIKKFVGKIFIESEEKKMLLEWTRMPYRVSKKSSFF